MKLTDRITLSDDAVWKATNDDQGVILNLSNGEYYSLNSVAKEIWEFISIRKDASLAEIEAEICNKFDVKESVAHSDIVELLKRLKAEKLIIIK